MRSSKFPQATENDERFTLAVPADLKAAVHALAAKRNLSASYIARQALAEFVGKSAA